LLAPELEDLQTALEQRRSSKTPTTSRLMGWEMFMWQMGTTIASEELTQAGMSRPLPVMEPTDLLMAEQR
jgi:hypothetical protein